MRGLQPLVVLNIDYCNPTFCERNRSINHAPDGDKFTLNPGGAAMVVEYESARLAFYHSGAGVILLG